MIACISPSKSDLNETLSTLRYASTFKKIKNKPTINNVKNAEIIDLKNEINRLKDLIKHGDNNQSM